MEPCFHCMENATHQERLAAKRGRLGNVGEAIVDCTECLEPCCAEHLVDADMKDPVCVGCARAVLAEKEVAA